VSISAARAKSGTLFSGCIRPIFLAANGGERLAPSESASDFASSFIVAVFGIEFANLCSACRHDQSQFFSPQLTAQASTSPRDQRTLSIA